ncbi:MAG: SDR family oxidoreductase [Acetobacteraceae bacterium]|nr:SDR family oxidoreductase [Acetobacteraceae bacterium]
MLQSLQLQGRLALVTGSSRGLGWAMAQGLAASGARVVLHGRDRDALDRRQQALAAAGTPAAGTVSFDVTDGPATARALQDIAAQHGALGILINNAGLILRRPVTETTDEDWQRVIDADLTSCFRLSREAIRQMQPAGWGRIIMTSSIMGRVARPTVPGYVTAKHALVGLVRALAVEFAASGITVNAIGPGYFPTEANQTLHEDPEFNRFIAARTPMGRWGRPEELQGAVVFLASDAASYVTGQILMVDGGLTAAL